MKEIYATKACKIRIFLDPDDNFAMNMPLQPFMILVEEEVYGIYSYFTIQ